MLNILAQKAQTEKATNITLVNKAWEDIVLGSDFSPCDVVVASLSFFMADLEKELKRMDAAANKQVYLFVSASKWMDDETRKIICPDAAPQKLPDHVYIFISSVT
jgi:hypothetical protein